MGWLVARWGDWLFSGTSAGVLGFHRALFYGVVLVHSLVSQRDLSRWALVSDALWIPTPFFYLMHLPVLSPYGLAALLALWRVSLLLSFLGLFTRVGTWSAFVMGFYVLGLPHNFGKINHDDAIVAIGLVIFALARCADGWSLDGLRRARVHTEGSAAAAPESGSYSWPLSLYRVMLALVPFAAGMAKLRGAGPLGWTLSDNLYYTLLRHHYTHSPPTEIGLLMARFPVTCRVLAGAALTLELLAPLLVVLPIRARTVLAAAIVLMMVGFWLMLGVLFAGFIMLLVIFFMPWKELGAWVVGRTSRRRLVVLYDGSCGLCMRTVAVVRACDLLRRVEVSDVLAEWDRLAAQFPGLDQQACLEDMHVVGRGGRVYTGFYAYRALAWQLPVGWPFLPVLYVPGIPAAGEMVYSFIARRRHAAGCPLPARPGSESLGREEPGREPATGDSGSNATRASRE